MECHTNLHPADKGRGRLRNTRGQWRETQTAPLKLWSQRNKLPFFIVSKRQSTKDFPHMQRIASLMESGRKQLSRMLQQIDRSMEGGLGIGPRALSWIWRLGDRLVAESASSSWFSPLSSMPQSSGSLSGESSKAVCRNCSPGLSTQTPGSLHNRLVSPTCRGDPIITIEVEFLPLGHQNPVSRQCHWA